MSRDTVPELRLHLWVQALLLLRTLIRNGVSDVARAARLSTPIRNAPPFEAA